MLNSSKNSHSPPRMPTVLKEKYPIVPRKPLKHPDVPKVNTDMLVQITKLENQMATLTDHISDINGEMDYLKDTMRCLIKDNLNLKERLDVIEYNTKNNEFENVGNAVFMRKKPSDELPLKRVNNVGDRVGMFDQFLRGLKLKMDKVGGEEKTYKNKRNESTFYLNELTHCTKRNYSHYNVFAKNRMVDGKSEQDWDMYFLKDLGNDNIVKIVIDRVFPTKTKRMLNLKTKGACSALNQYLTDIYGEIAVRVKVPDPKKCPIPKNHYHLVYYYLDFDSVAIIKIMPKGKILVKITVYDLAEKNVLLCLHAHMEKV